MINNWTGHGKFILEISAWTTNDDNKVNKNILDFKVLVFKIFFFNLILYEANPDKSSIGILSDIEPWINQSEPLLPVICDNYAVMVALEKNSSEITKIYYLEHKLTIFENFIHIFEPF